MSTMNILVFLFLLIIRGAFSLRNVYLIFPKYVAEGGNTSIFCYYDLQGEQLYSLKWYRGVHEFYRFQPRDNPKIHLFSLPGLSIDLNSSNSNRVRLLNVPMHLKGNFTCEVSVEEPTYSTSLVTHYLEVIPRNEENRTSFEIENNIQQPDNLIECAPENKSSVSGCTGVMLIILVAMKRFILISYL